ncbi:uncharacterized protein LOC117176719 [Belonocnema kinseyi]|uniref:uncharacterized protein LOC117176719 n=1 Tax=Belonocnema kinseyi TaxID=2817044 RepID=UPI00143D689D|nr:uncharacterized protein LOC117176719 [Belonocnema kinseyi]
MVHISGDGQLVQSRPWSLTRFLGEIYNVISLYFSTLISPSTNRHGNRYSRDYRPGSGPLPPSRRIGRINNTPSVNVPGGCRSCQG